MFKGKKTALFALLLIVAGAVQGFNWTTLIDDPATVGWVVSGIGAAVAVLRALTDTALFENK